MARHSVLQREGEWMVHRPMEQIVEDSWGMSAADPVRDGMFVGEASRDDPVGHRSMIEIGLGKRCGEGEPPSLHAACVPEPLDGRRVLSDPF